MNDKWRTICDDGKPHKIVFLGIVKGHVCKKCGRSLVELNSDRALPYREIALQESE